MEHCSCLIRIQDPVDEHLAESDNTPLQYPTSGKVWYKAQAEAGYGFGPSFQKLLKVESSSGQRQSRAQVLLAEPASKWSPQSYYPIHPAALDGCFQTVTPALWAGERSLCASWSPGGLSLASSECSGRGRLEEAKSYFANCSVYHPDTGALLMQMSALRFAKLDTGIKADPHVFDCISWKPDITFFSQEKLGSLDAENSETQLDSVINLIAHKRPALRMVEVSLNHTETRSIWFESEDPLSRSAYLQYHFASGDAKGLVSIQNKYKAKSNSSFFIVNPTKDAIDLPQNAIYDLVILKVAKNPVVDQSLNGSLDYIKSHLSEKGFALVVQESDLQSSNSSVTIPPLDEISQSPSSIKSPETPLTVNESSEVTVRDSDIPIINEHITPDEVQELKEKLLESVAGVTKRLSNSIAIQEAMEMKGITSVLQIANDNDSPAWSLYTSQVKITSQPRKLSVVRLSETTPSLDPSLKAVLEVSGWTITEVTYSPNNVAATGTVLLILDELHNPVLTQINATQWEGLKMLINSGNPLLWVTKGAQYKVTDPDNALVHGLFRVARREDPSVKLSVLDVESSAGPATNYAIDAVLNSLEINHTDSKTVIETEFIKRNGTLYVQRIVPDLQVNEFKRGEVAGAEPALKNLHETEAAVQLRAERLGTFQSLTWCETAVGEVPVDSGKIEVEVMAVDVNFKDVAVTMRIVPANEYTTGYEGAGIVKRLGPGVINFKVGDRVCFLNGGSYANRLQMGVGQAHIIPDSISFEDAATIPSVYLCSIYSLYDIANLREGQSVLIHSASGGVGIACIQLAQYKRPRFMLKPATRKLNLRPDASYLIVGGLKGLCGSLAIHMARHGAKNIIACSRSGISDVASQKIVKNCLAYGCDVVDAQGDAASVGFMRKVFKEASPRIAGIIQGAMILRDKPLETVTLDDYHTALHAKFNGTWNLHHVSQEQKEPLDFFTLLSSISGIVGKKGQANYATGNTFLDAFAQYRETLGLRANSVDLGLIEDVGYVAEQEGFDSCFDKGRWTPVTENTLRKILSYSICSKKRKHRLIQSMCGGDCNAIYQDLTAGNRNGNGQTPDIILIGFARSSRAAKLDPY
ncbi:hypothetical protein BCON_0130g00320 [Botryotinia convoluta]|uniref:PKS/mFAS DH domain-containing protein n=1 Tax=Botryotinia convoluta TaxID=54673 RepID=A0A4Z1I8Z9_9HELO|nr:hypothetical protein BCON_0130g00320 [Botryotinia convoluta]